METAEELSKDKKIKKLPHIEKNSEKTANKDLLKAYKFIVKKVQTQNKVKQRIEKTFLELVPKIDKIMKIKDEGKVDESLFDPLVKIIDKIDKLKNYISGQNLKKYIENVLQIAVYHQELELAKISVAPSDTKMEKVNKLLEWAEMHKYWMFSAAGGINADMEVTKKASENLVKELKKRGLIEKSEIGEVKEEFKLSI